MSCNYSEPFFGASYPDACCIDGYLWDLDSSHGPENQLHSGGEVPCPQCNHDAFIEHYADVVKDLGYCAASEGKPREYQHSKFREEQEGDEAKARQWWFEGYDEFSKKTNQVCGN